MSVNQERAACVCNIYIYILYIEVQHAQENPAMHLVQQHPASLFRGLQSIRDLVRCFEVLHLFSGRNMRAHPRLSSL